MNPQFIRAILVACLVIYGCGQLAISGLKPGEKRLTQQLPPHVPQPTPSPSSFHYYTTYQGEVDDEVFIAEREIVKFLLDDAGNVPVFTKKVTVMNSAVLDGSADFRAGIEIQGKSDSQVVWNIDPDEPTVWTHPIVNWLTLHGPGRVLVNGLLGRESIITNSSFRGMDLETSPTIEAKLSLTRSEIIYSTLHVSFDANSPSEPLVRITNNEFRHSGIDFYNFDVDSFSIEANNFKSPPQGDGSYYFRGIPDALAESFFSMVAPANFCTVRKRLFTSLKLVASHRRDNAGLRTPFLAGPGSRMDVFLQDDKGRDRVQLSANYKNWFVIDGIDHMSSYLIWSQAKAAFKKEGQGFSIEDEGFLVVEVLIQEPVGCEKANWYAFLCDGAFELPLKIVARTEDEVVDWTYPLNVNTSTSLNMELALRRAAIEIFETLMVKGLVDAVPIHTPYF